MWVDHHALFLRVKNVDTPVLVPNIGLLLGASLVPWPTALLPTSLRFGDGDGDDQAASTLVYVATTVIVAVPWTGLNLHLAHRPDLLDAPASSRCLRRNAAQAGSSPLLAAAAAAPALVTPLASLLIFHVAPLLFLATNLRATTRRAPR